MGEIFEKLGLSGWEILFHAINLVILVVALYFLLYRPVKRIVANHRKKLDDIYKENMRLRDETESMKGEYDALKQKAAEEAAAVNERAMQRSREIIAEAQEQADVILDSAQKEAVVEKQRVQYELHDAVGHIAVEIAEKILEREINEEDNRRIIDASLSEWEK